MSHLQRTPPAARSPTRCSRSSSASSWSSFAVMGRVLRDRLSGGWRRTPTSPTSAAAACCTRSSRRDRATKEPFPTETRLTSKVVAAGLAEDVFFYPGGTDPARRDHARPGRSSSLRRRSIACRGARSAITNAVRGQRSQRSAGLNPRRLLLIELKVRRPAARHALSGGGARCLLCGFRRRLVEEGERAGFDAGLNHAAALVDQGHHHHAFALRRARAGADSRGSAR